MKKFFTSVCLLLTTTLFAMTLSAQGVKWETGSLQEALTKAKTTKKGPKLIFMDCFTSWCGPCKFMTNTIFPTKEAGDYFNKNFVNIKFDMEKGEGVEIAQKYGVRVYPTFLILNQDGNEIGRVIGSEKTAEVFINKVEFAKDPANSVSALLNKFNETHELSDALNYLNKSEDMYIDANIADFFTQDLSYIRQYDRYSLRVWHFASKAISFEKPYFLNEILDNRETIYLYLGKPLVDQTIIDGVSWQLLLYLDGKCQVSQEVLDKSIASIKALCNKKSNYYETLLANVAEAYSKKDVAKINELLNNRGIFYSDLSLIALSRLTTFYMNCDFIPQADKDQYNENLKKSISQLIPIPEYNTSNN